MSSYFFRSLYNQIRYGFYLSNMKNKTKQFLTSRYFIYFLIIITSLIIRIPQKFQIHGDDSFEVIWMAQAIKEGALFSENSWIIHFLSIFGIYPYSHYPIGIPLVFSLFLIIGIPITASVFIIDISVLILGLIGIYKLSKMINNSTLFISLSLVFYGLSSNDFLKLTLLTLHPRGILIAITPWFVYYLLKTLEKTNAKNILKSLLLFLILILCHKLSILHLFYFVALIIGKIITTHKFQLFLQEYLIKFLKRYLKNYLKYLAKIILVLCYGGIIIISYNFLPFVYGSAGSPFFNNATLFGNIANLVINYITRFGILVLAFPFGIIYLMDNRSSKKISNNSLVFLISILFPLFLLWKLQIYSTVVFHPIYCIISVLGLQYIFSLFERNKFMDNNKTVIIGFLYLIMAIILNILYTVFFVQMKFVYIFVIITTAIFFCHFLFIKFKIKLPDFNKSYLMIMFLIISSVFTNYTFLEGRNKTNDLSSYPFTTDFSKTHITDDELQVIDFINSEGCDGLVITSSHLLSRRIGGMGFLPTIPGNHEPQIIYYNWKPKELIKSNVFFNITYFLNTLRLGLHYIGDYEVYILNKIINLNVTELNDYYMLQNYNVQYIITYKNIENNQVYPYFISPYGSSFSLLLNSLNAILPSFSTRYLLVWKIY